MFNYGSESCLLFKIFILYSNANKKLGQRELFKFCPNLFVFVLENPSL